ncbi:hypothetical protein [Bacillus weihaiensis]|uniref:Uncharacterized protein n=1 Tax=Bacillus weihaiensis TaxID=1547283 RepID=A0A1L3MVM4_9BACI|nr:hypothetical protein [Bacillus weihaiensis]APH06376.1 hypothetical protein A9C19_17470 [Bacillus weihaiensis]
MAKSFGIRRKTNIRKWVSAFRQFGKRRLTKNSFISQVPGFLHGMGVQSIHLQLAFTYIIFTSSKNMSSQFNHVM